MSDPINGEALTYWLVAAGTGTLFWILGYFDARRVNPVALPSWLRFLVGVRHGQDAYLGKVTVQILGLFLFIWATVISLVAVSRQQRIALTVLGFLVLIALAGIFLGIIEILVRIRRPK